MESKKEILKELIRKLHTGTNIEDVKKEFKKRVGDISPLEIAQLEEELIKEGISREEILKMCDVHLAMFQESIKSKKSIVHKDHPIDILMEEHNLLLDFAEKLKEITKALLKEPQNPEHLSTFNHIIQHFKDSESHYLREENGLFPFLEKHGITQPPSVMWMEHNQIREIKKKLYKAQEELEKGPNRDLINLATTLQEMLSNHFYKENNILFPTSLKVISREEWEKIKKNFDEIGYCCFTPAVKKEVKEEPKLTVLKEEIVEFPTGKLTVSQLEAILNTLPIDITFVDKEDTVKYYSASKERIFVRTPAVIGRKVQLCHPQKSLHLVNQILDDFKSGKRDVAEFWINYHNRLVYIRYFAVRNSEGDYLGCLEVTQDITEIQKIRGEKRLLE